MSATIPDKHTDSVEQIYEDHPEVVERMAERDGYAGMFARAVRDYVQEDDEDQEEADA